MSLSSTIEKYDATAAIRTHITTTINPNVSIRYSFGLLVFGLRLMGLKLDRRLINATIKITLSRIIFNTGLGISAF